MAISRSPLVLLFGLFALLLLFIPNLSPLTNRFVVNRGLVHLTRALSSCPALQACAEGDASLRQAQQAFTPQAVTAGQDDRQRLRLLYAAYLAGGADLSTSVSEPLPLDDLPASDSPAWQELLQSLWRQGTFLVSMNENHTERRRVHASMLAAYYQRQYADSGHLDSLYRWTLYQFKAGDRSTTVQQNLTMLLESATLDSSRREQALLMAAFLDYSAGQMEAVEQRLSDLSPEAQQNPALPFVTLYEHIQQTADVALFHAPAFQSLFLSGRGTAWQPIEGEPISRQLGSTAAILVGTHVEQEILRDGAPVTVALYWRSDETPQPVPANWYAVGDNLWIEPIVALNLAPNGGFEWDSASQAVLPSGWNYLYKPLPSGHQVVPEPATTGSNNQCLLLDGRDAQDPRAGVQTDWISTASGESLYLFGGRVWDELGEGSGRLGLRWRDAGVSRYYTLSGNLAAPGWSGHIAATTLDRPVTIFLSNWYGSGRICMDNVFLLRLDLDHH